MELIVSLGERAFLFPDCQPPMSLESPSRPAPDPRILSFEARPSVDNATGRNLNSAAAGGRPSTPVPHPRVDPHGLSLGISRGKFNSAVRSFLARRVIALARSYVGRFFFPRHAEKIPPRRIISFHGIPPCRERVEAYRREWERVKVVGASRSVQRLVEATERQRKPAGASGSK